jgi:hypothetical protein
MLLSIVMSVPSVFFPAGLVFCPVTNTLLSIAQRCNVNRRIGAEVKKQRTGWVDG